MNNGCPCKCHSYGAVHCWCFQHRLQHPLVERIINAKNWQETRQLMYELYATHLSRLGR